MPGNPVALFDVPTETPSAQLTNVTWASSLPDCPAVRDDVRVRFQEKRILRRRSPGQWIGWRWSAKPAAIRSGFVGARSERDGDFRGTRFDGRAGVDDLPEQGCGASHQSGMSVRFFPTHQVSGFPGGSETVRDSFLSLAALFRQLGRSVRDAALQTFGPGGEGARHHRLFQDTDRKRAEETA